MDYDDFQKMKEKSKDKKLFHPSESGFDLIHRDLALVYHGAIYEHNLEAKWREDVLQKKKNQLEEYISSIQNIKREEYDNWSSQNQKSFLLNAYHAYLIKKMIDQNFENLEGLSESLKINLFNKSCSYEDFIQKEIIPLDDPRMIMALKCFKDNCPEFRNTVYNFKGVEGMLEVSATRFLVNETKYKLDKEKKVLALSSFLSSYKEALPSNLKDYVLNFIKHDKELYELVSQKDFSVVVFK